MGRFTQNEETMIVKNAMELTAAIEIETAELRRLKAEKFRSMPNPPERKIVSPTQKVQPQYPEAPETDYEFMEYFKPEVTRGVKKLIIPLVIIIVCAILGIKISIFMDLSMTIVFACQIWFVVYLVRTCKAFLVKHKELNNQLRNSPEYLNAIAEAESLAKEEQNKREEEARIKQAKLDNAYKEQKRFYETVTVPKYNEAFESWKEKKQKKIMTVEEEIRLNKEALKELYDSTRIVSASYRDLWILNWLYEDMSTSDHDIRYATELLDRDRQRMITEKSGDAIRQMENSMMNGLYAVYNAIDHGNSIGEKTIDVLSKTRRDMNIGNLIGTVQRHNTNKMLENM